MLILSRYVGKKVYIGEDVCIMLVTIDKENTSAEILITLKRDIGPICTVGDYANKEATFISFDEPKVFLRRVYYNQSLFIGDDITVRLLEIHGHKAVFGFMASPDIVIYRDEVFEKIQKMKQSSTTPSAFGSHPSSGGELLRE
jgi:carbon storage regulator CsrA